MHVAAVADPTKNTKRLSEVVFFFSFLPATWSIDRVVFYFNLVRFKPFGFQLASTASVIYKVNILRQDVYYLKYTVSFRFVFVRVGSGIENIRKTVSDISIVDGDAFNGTWTWVRRVDGKKTEMKTLLRNVSLP